MEQVRHSGCVPFLGETLGYPQLEALYTVHSLDDQEAWARIMSLRGGDIHWHGPVRGLQSDKVVINRQCTPPFPIDHASDAAGRPVNAFKRSRVSATQFAPFGRLTMAERTR